VLPKKMVCDGFVLKVEKLAGVTDTELGRCEPQNATLYVNPLNDPQMQRTSLIHEWLHFADGILHPVPDDKGDAELAASETEKRVLQMESIVRWLLRNDLSWYKEAE